MFFEVHFMKEENSFIKSSSIFSGLFFLSLKNVLSLKKKGCLPLVNCSTKKFLDKSLSRS